MSAVDETPPGSASALRLGLFLPVEIVAEIEAARGRMIEVLGVHVSRSQAVRILIRRGLDRPDAR